MNTTGDTDRLTSFLFILMRDHVPTGTVANIIRNYLNNNINTYTQYVYEGPDSIAGRELYHLAKVYSEKIQDGARRSFESM